jgi:hypothetical protein
LIVHVWVALALATGLARAQTVTNPSTQTAPPKKAMVGYIAADSAPYRIEWTGTGGTFVQHPYAQEPARRIPMDYLHAQAGPTGYSKHLAWFIARDADAFNILWLYLDDAGTDFGCWLYQYPSNRLTYQRFTGNYRFTPPAVTPPPNLNDGIALRRPPRYTGTDFTYRDWTREMGTLANLPLFSPPAEGPVVGANAAPRAGAVTRAPDRTLSALRVAPLHQIRVGEANGWRNGGWQELHCLALDTSDDPYYLILYSNETTGFVVDIKHAQTYTADFGARVKFAEDASITPKVNGAAGQGDLRIRRYDWHGFTLRTAQNHANAYTEVNLLGEFVGPNGKKIQIPGFWDGGNRFSLRFSPGLVGDWTWRTRSNDPDLNGLEGTFECVTVDGQERAFFGVHPDRSYRRHFATREGKPIFPMALHDPVFNAAPAELKANGAKVATASEADEAALPASFLAFRKRVETWATKGVNRFVGGYLIDHDAFTAKEQANEGGMPFLDNDLDRPNPEYFHWMDRRIAYCNEHGIVPDVGFGWPSTGLFQKYSDVQLRRAWLTVVARYAAMDIAWNLFGDDGQPMPEGAEARIAAFAELTHLYDPGRHALTLLQKGPVLPEYHVIEPLPPGGDGGRQQPTAPVPPAPTVTALPDYPWLDYTTLVGGNAAAVDLFAGLDKPVVVWPNSGLPTKGEAVSPDITRRWLWETRMRNAYWVGSADSRAAADSPDVKMALDCAAFFRQTKWWRLNPHSEMLNGREETPAERRRRRKSEEEAGVAPPQNPNRPGGVARPTEGARFLLADPGREYVAYLEHGGHVTLDLIDTPGRMRFVWFSPHTGKSLEQPDRDGGDYTTFVAPDSDDWVLYLSRH